MVTSTLVKAALVILTKELYELHKGDEGALDQRSLAMIATLLALSLASYFVSSGGKPRPGASGKPVLAVDLDEVCCGYLPAFIKFSNHIHKTSLELKDFKSYMFWEVKGTRLANREAALDRVYEFHASKYFAQIEPLNGAKLALDVLKKRFELHVVTSRQTDIREQTRTFCAKEFPGVFTDLHFGNHFGKSKNGEKVAKVSKPDMCKKIGAVALIDDSKDYARQCEAAGIPVFLFGDYPWNQLKKDEPKFGDTVERVSSWRMVAQKVSPEVVEGMRS